LFEAQNKPDDSKNPDYLGCDSGSQKIVVFCQLANKGEWWFREAVKIPSSGCFWERKSRALNAPFWHATCLCQDCMNEKIKEFRRSPRDSSPEKESGALRCGEVIPESGIYEAIHKRDHEKEHSVLVVAIRGEHVQACAGCGEAVSLRLVRGAPHISEDADFCHPRE
jgi:hypothetical protein